MDSKTKYDLKPEQIQTTILNIKSSSNDLVKKVLAEETTFREECQKLETYAKEEFYQRRDELIEVLNQYDFEEIISEDKKNKLDYEILHKEFKKSKRKNTLTGLSGAPSGAAIAYLISLFDGGLSLIGLTIVMSIYSGLGLATSNLIARTLRGSLPKKSVAMKVYYDLMGKSIKADRFMNDFRKLEDDVRFLKKHSLLNIYLNEDSDTILDKNLNRDD